MGTLVQVLLLPFVIKVIGNYRLLYYEKVASCQFLVKFLAAWNGGLCDDGLSKSSGGIRHTYKIDISLLIKLNR